MSNISASGSPELISLFTNALMISVLLLCSFNAFLKTLFCTVKISFSCIFFFVYFMIFTLSNNKTSSSSFFLYHLCDYFASFMLIFLFNKSINNSYNLNTKLVQSIILSSLASFSRISLSLSVKLKYPIFIINFIFQKHSTWFFFFSTFFNSSFFIFDFF